MATKAKTKEQLDHIVRRVINGRTLVFNEKNHRFWEETTDGSKNYLTSVTGYTGIIDKPGLKYWAVDLCGDYLKAKIENGEQITILDIVEACKQHTIRKEEAADIGTKIHDIISLWIQGKDINFEDMEDEVRIGFESFLAWQAEEGYKFLDTEQILCSWKNWYAGKRDSKAIDKDGKRGIIDFKSANSLQAEHFVQSILYGIADEEETGEPLDWVVAARFAKETEEQYHVRMKKKNRPYDPYKVFDYRKIPMTDKIRAGALGSVSLKNLVVELEEILK